MADDIDNQWRELTYEQFKVIVLDRVADSEKARVDLRAYYKSDGVNEANVGGMLFEVVCRLLNPMSFEVREKLRRFERRVIWDAVSKSESVYPIGAVIEVLLDAKKSESESETTVLNAQFDASFAGAVAAAVDRVVIGGPYTSEDVYRQMRFRDFDEGRSAVELRDRGYCIEMDREGRLLLTNDAQNRLFCRLDSLMSKIGGCQALHMIWRGDSRFPKMIPLLCGKRQHSRWPFCRIWADDFEFGCKFEELFPYNYWLNLAVKHFGHGGDASEADVAECVDLILAYSRFVNVIPSAIKTAFDVMHPKQFIPILQKIANYSHLYKIDQMRIKDAVDIIEFCSCGYCSKRLKGLVTLSHVVCVLKALMITLKGKRGPQKFAVAEICAMVGGLRTEIVKTVLDLFVAKGGIPNQKFVNPNDPSGYDLYRKPIIRFGDCYFVVDPSMAASGLLSCFMFSGFFGAEPDDRKIGPLVEEMVRVKFQAKGLNPKTGFFGVRESGRHDEYEADAVLTDGCSIIAVEVKKKSMKEDSRCGNSLQLMRDLAAGLLDDVKQARRCLGELARHHTLGLHKKRNDKVPIHTLSYRGGEKLTVVAMPLFDYDAFQTPAFTRSFFHKCGESIDVRFSGEGLGPSEEDCRSCQQLNKSLGQYQEVAKGYPEMRDVPVAVISIPQMLCLLDEVNSAKEFHEIVSGLPHVDFGSFDFYMAVDCLLAREGRP